MKIFNLLLLTLLAACISAPAQVREASKAKLVKASASSSETATPATPQPTPVEKQEVTSSNAAKVDGPSMQETVDFILAKVQPTEGSKITGPERFVFPDGSTDVRMNTSTLRTRVRSVSVDQKILNIGYDETNIWDNKDQYYGDNRNEYTALYNATASLSDLDPSTVRVVRRAAVFLVTDKISLDQPVYSLVLQCSNGKACFTLSGEASGRYYTSTTDQKGPITGTQSSFVFVVGRDEEAAQKIVKAFQHAITISGGKGDIF